MSIILSTISISICLFLLAAYIRLTRKSRVQEYFFIDYDDNLENVINSYPQEYIDEMNKRVEAYRLTHQK